MRSDTEPIATLKNIAAEYLCMTVRYDDFSVEWLGYATARLEPEGGPVAYTDPGRYGVLDDYWARDGDIVVVTHDHHYDPDGIRSVAREDATLVIYDAVDSAGIDRDVESIDSLADDYDVIRVTTRRASTWRPRPARSPSGRSPRTTTPRGPTPGRTAR